MLTLAVFVIQEAITGTGPEWLWHPPSIFTIVDFTMTLAIATFFTWHLWQYKKNKKKEAPQNPRDYHTFAARLGKMEAEQHEMRERLEVMAIDASNRHEERVEALHNLVDVSTKQYESAEKQTRAIEKLVGQNAWILKTLQDRPCIINEDTNGDEVCPDGHDILKEGDK